VVEKGALLEGEGENGERLYGVEMDGDNDLFYGEEADEFTEGEDLVAYMAGIGLSSPAAEPMVLMMAAEQRRGRAADDGGRTERSCRSCGRAGPTMDRMGEGREGRKKCPVAPSGFGWAQEVY
jgi:hypothetical protein